MIYGGDYEDDYNMEYLRYIKQHTQSDTVAKTIDPGFGGGGGGAGFR